MYLITFYICICLIILILSNAIYVSIAFSKNKFNVVWPMKILKSVISFLVSVLFMPIFGKLSIYNH
jgi:hypothetical protein